MSDSELSEEVLDNLANERLEESCDESASPQLQETISNRLKRLHQEVRRSPSGGETGHNEFDEDDEIGEESAQIKTKLQPGRERSSVLLSSSSRVMGTERISETYKREAQDDTDSSEAEVEEEVRPPPVKVPKFDNGSEPLKKRIAKSWDQTKLDRLEDTMTQKSTPTGAYSEVALRMMVLFFLYFINRQGENYNLLLILAKTWL